MKKNYNEPVLSIDKFSVIDIVTTSSQPGTTPQPTLKEMLDTIKGTISQLAI